MTLSAAPESTVMLRHNAVRQHAAAGSLASYGEDMVSFPTGSEQPCHLADILPDTWREVLDHFEGGMLLPEAERDALADDADILQQ